MNEADRPDDEGLRHILQGCRTVAVVGLSASAYRPSHDVAAYLQRHGYRVIPVNPNHAGESILGELVWASLDELPEPVQMVNVFRRTEDVLPVAEGAVRVGAACLWQQIGVVNDDADRLARAAGLRSVMNLCLKVEHARLLGAQHATRRVQRP